jgi:hypothetical protein
MSLFSLSLCLSSLYLPSTFLLQTVPHRLPPPKKFVDDRRGETKNERERKFSQIKAREI